MLSQKVKTKLLGSMSKENVVRLQAWRFVYLLKTRKEKDPEEKILHHFLKEGDVAIDVGANGADWTSALSRQVADSGRIYAFEADPYYAAATKMTVHLMKMKNVEFFSFGLSNKNEELPLRVFDETGLRYSGLGYIDKDANEDDKSVVRVPLKTLDSLAENDSKISEAKFIKCDVEGFELFVFQGAPKVIEEAQPVVLVEVGNFEQQDYTSEDLYRFFKERGYICYALNSSGKLVESDEHMEHDGAASVNRLLIPNSKKELIGSLLE